MNKAAILLSALILTVMPLAGAAPDLGVFDEEPSLEEDYIVGFDRLPERLTEPGATYQGEEVTKVVEKLHFIVVHTDNWVEFEAQAKQDDRVRYIEEDHNDYHLAYTPNDARYVDQYGPQITNTETAWDTTLGSTSVIVGLLDTGINEAHEDFDESVVSGYDYVNDDSTPEDDGQCSYHGSHTAGTAAAVTDNGVGIAGMSNSAIIMHKIFDNGGFFGCGGASSSGIAQALADLGDKGAHVSSNSWGGGSNSTAINDAIDYAHSKGVIHVAAAGNDGSCTDCIGQPWEARQGKVNIVTCSDESDAFCSFSSQGSEADIIAPGNSVLSVDGGTTTGYQNMDGTSMSTPHVAGAIALYIAANGDPGFETIEDDLKSSADDLGLSAERQGAGRLNTGAFLSAGGGGGGNSAPTASFTYSCTDLTCDFDGTGSSDPDGDTLSYSWDFGDGNTATGATVTHTFASSGDYTVTLTVDDGSATDTDSQVVSVSDGSSGSSTLLDEDFEDGSADGWTKSSDANDLWRVASDCVAPAGGTYDLAFSRPASDCDYDVGTAYGWANTPTLDASGASTVTLTFDHFWETESYSGTYDIMEVQVSDDGGSSWTTIAHWDSSDANPSGWSSQSYDLSSYATSNLEIRFVFDSVDSVSNDYAGWYVDNVVVTAE